MRNEAYNFESSGVVQELELAIKVLYMVFCEASVANKSHDLS